MRAVNLLPRDEPTRSFEAKRGIVFLGGGGAALVTVALATLMLGASAAANEQRQALDGINAELAAVPKAEPGETEPQDDTALVAEKSARISALSTVLSGRVAWDEVLRQVSQVLPEDVWLSNLSTSADATSSTKLTLNGSTYSQDGVARFLSRISMLPSLENVQLQTSANSSSGTVGVVQFVILADVKAPGSGATS
jgi:Tfp pilus assembly protein PilN